MLALTAAGMFAVAQPRGAFARPAPIKVQDGEALVQLDEDDDDEQLLLDEAALHDEDERDGI